MSVATRDPIVPQPRPIRARDRRTGATLMLVPSASREGLYHLTTATTCDCAGWKYRKTCSHLGAALSARTSEPRPCVCGNYHLTELDRRRAHPDANRQSEYAQALGEPTPEAPRIPLVARMYA